MSGKENVVFIRSMRFLGGHLVTYPLLHQIKHHYPDQPLTIVGTDPVGSNYLATPWVDRFVQANTTWDKLKACTRAQRVFVLHYSSEQYAPLSFARRVPIRVGFRNRRVSDILWTHACKKRPDEYLGLANLNLLRCLTTFNPVDAARSAMRQLAQRSRDSIAPTDVVLMPGGGAGAYKRWRIEAYIELMEKLKTHMGNHTSFSFIMGPDEVAEEHKVRALGRLDIQIVQGKPMSTIAALALNARLVVANDCGPSHIAQNAAPTYVGVFHAPNPQWFWNRPQAAAVVPDNGSTDIQTISVEQVFKAAQSALAA